MIVRCSGNPKTRLAVAAEAVDGFTIRPAVLPHDLALLVDETVPLLRERGLFRTAYAGNTLRDHLGLGRPPNRYAVSA